MTLRSYLGFGKVVLFPPRFAPIISCIVKDFSRAKSWFFNESDLTEEFVRGWGPGGQKINKTANCVVLRHNPTGIVVKCQESRELHLNRELARRWLNERLDVHLNGEESDLIKAQRKHQSREIQRHLNAKKRLAAKLAFKEREGLQKKIEKNESQSGNT